jgi:hypothetical protein
MAAAPSTEVSVSITAAARSAISTMPKIGDQLPRR